MTKLKEQTLQKPVIVCLIAAICSFLWGSAIPCIKIGYEMFRIESADTWSQILFAGIRFMIAGVMALFCGSIGEKKLLLPDKKSIIPSCILSLFQTVLQYFFFYIGLSETSGVKSSVIVASNVFIAILIAAFIFKSEKITVRKALGSAVGFIGILIINLDGLTSGRMRITGEGFILLSTVAYSISSGLMKNYSKRISTTLLSGWQFIIGGIVMTAIGLLCGGKIQAYGFKPMLMLLYLAFVSAAAYSLWSMLLKYNDISSVAIYGFMNPMFGYFLSAVLLNEAGEALGLKALIALLLVCAGILIVNGRQTAK